MLAAALRAKYEWFAQRTDHLAAALAPALQSKATELAHRLDVLGRALAPALQSKAAEVAHRLDALSRSLGSAVTLDFTRREAAFDRLKEKLALLSPYSVLERGYSLTTDAQGAVVRSAAQVKPGDVLHTRLAQGEVVSTAN